MSGIVLGAREGEVADALGIRVRFLAVHAATNSRLEALEGEFPAHLSFPTHVHADNDEAFYVLQGQIDISVGERSLRGEPGVFGFAPRGTAHGFDNKGDSPARVLIFQVPGIGNTAFMQELRKLPPGPPDMEKLLPILRRFDIQPLG